MSAEPYELGLARPARRAICQVLPEDVAAAAVGFITGPLLEAPYRVGRPLRDRLAGFHSARLGTQWRVLYRIDESKRIVVVQDIQHRSSAYRRRLALGSLPGDGNPGSSPMSSRAIGSRSRRGFDPDTV